MDVVIGIDTGTTATKAVAAGLDAELRAQATVHYPLSVPGPGRAELDPEQLRNAAVKALVDMAGECRERGDRVIAVSLSAFLHAVVPMDAAGHPLGPLVTSADGRAAAQLMPRSTHEWAAGYGQGVAGLFAGSGPVSGGITAQPWTSMVRWCAPCGCSGAHCPQRADATRLFGEAYPQRRS